MNHAIILSALLIVYCTIHSLLISLPVTNFIKRKTGKRFCYFRLFFNVFSVVSLIPVVYYDYVLHHEPFFVWSGSLLYLKYGMIISGAGLLVAGARQYSFSHFIGINQIKTQCVEENNVAADKLNTSGVLGLIRHPWYTAVILLLWSRNLDYSNLIVNIIFSLYLLAGAWLEEKKLIKAFGNIYLHYRQTVSMFLPFKWISKFLTSQY